MYNLWELLTLGDNPNAQLQLNYCEIRLLASKECKWTKEIMQIIKLSVSAWNRKLTPWSVFSQKHKYFIHTSPYVQSYIISDFHCLARVEKHTCISYMTSHSGACKSNMLIWAPFAVDGKLLWQSSVCRLSVVGRAPSAPHRFYMAVRQELKAILFKPESLWLLRLLLFSY